MIKCKARVPISTRKGTRLLSISIPQPFHLTVLIIYKTF